MFLQIKTGDREEKSLTFICRRSLSEGVWFSSTPGGNIWLSLLNVPLSYAVNCKHCLERVGAAQVAQRRRVRVGLP